MDRVRTALRGYRAGTIKRERRIFDRINLLDDQIISVFRADHLPAEHLFCRMAALPPGAAP